jgi:hypothetical protein
MPNIAVPAMLGIAALNLTYVARRKPSPTLMAPRSVGGFADRATGMRHSPMAASAGKR